MARANDDRAAKGGQGQHCRHCGEAHASAACPWYKSPHLEHPDTALCPGDSRESKVPTEYLDAEVEVVAVDGDGSCMFSCMAIGEEIHNGRGEHLSIAVCAPLLTPLRGAQ